MKHTVRPSMLDAFWRLVRVTSRALLCLAVFTLPAQAAEPRDGREVSAFDQGWRFLKADAPAAEQPGFDDSAWRAVELPHDWSIEGPLDQENPSGAGGGYAPTGVGWYRKSFTLPAAEQGRTYFVEFDGVMANSAVWINGVKLGDRPYGYVSFGYELTPHLKFGGEPNVIAVRADTSQQPASRWYTGAGIYRHVRLVATHPVHLERWGTFVTTPQVSAKRATVRVQNEVVNRSAAPREVSLEIRITDASGRTVKTTRTAQKKIAPGESARFESEVAVASPQLWSLETPTLYSATTRLRSQGQSLDEERTPFGIRSFKFEAASGFWLNGRNLKIKGVCLHHDASALGAAVPLSAWRRQLELLAAVGVNAIRTAHNPPAPEFLDLADQMGFLVMEEMFDSWTVAKNPHDYHLYFNEWSAIDTRDTVRRDRNHPSIILYSAGNEIHDTKDAELAQGILSRLVAVFHENDPTRPVTQGIFRPNVTHDYENGFADLLDVVGQNYRENELAAAQVQKPTRKIIGTENGHARQAWLALRDNPAMAGQFLWTGFDYLGEAQRWPRIAFNFGLYDRTGLPRPRAYQRQSWWSGKPMVYVARRVATDALQPTDPGYGQDKEAQVLFSDWTPSITAAHQESLEVYSNAEQVELLLNGRSLGTKPRNAGDAPLNWTVPYEPGTLRAVARNQGRVVATYELKTAGPARRVLLSAQRSRIAPIWDDVAYVEAMVVDEHGVPVPNAAPLISFKASGPGRIVAVDSGDNASHEPFQATERKAYQGRSIALVKASAAGEPIVVEASASGLESGVLTLNQRP